MPSHHNLRRRARHRRHCRHPRSLRSSYQTQLGLGALTLAVRLRCGRGGGARTGMGRTDVGPRQVTARLDIRRLKPGRLAPARRAQVATLPRRPVSSVPRCAVRTARTPCTHARAVGRTVRARGRDRARWCVGARARPRVRCMLVHSMPHAPRSLWRRLKPGSLDLARLRSGGHS